MLANPLIAGLGTPEILIIIVVIVLLFGAKKLPELARGSGQALRIFKAETKDLIDGDEKKKTDATDEAQKTEAQREIDARAAQERVERERRAEPDA